MANAMRNNPAKPPPPGGQPPDPESNPDVPIQALFDQWLGDNYGGLAWGKGWKELLSLLGYTQQQLEEMGIDKQEISYYLTQQNPDLLAWAQENNQMGALLSEMFENAGKPDDTGVYGQYIADKKTEQGYTQGYAGWGLYDESGRFLGTQGSIRRAFEAGATGIPGGLSWEDLGGMGWKPGQDWVRPEQAEQGGGWANPPEPPATALASAFSALADEDLFAVSDTVSQMLQARKQRASARSFQSDFFDFSDFEMEE